MRRNLSSSKPDVSYQLESPKFVSLRVKLLLGFSVIFSIVFAGAFYWFYTFTTDKTIDRLRMELKSTLKGAAEGVDVEELLSLYETGERNAAGFSSDPRYKRQLEWFETVHRLRPDTWLYSMVVGKAADNRRIGPAVVAPDEQEIIYLVDSRVNYLPEKAVKFLEPDILSLRARKVLETGELAEHSRLYTDKWGTWLSASAPLKNEAGEVVAILGLDIDARHVREIQQTIRHRVIIAFATAYGVLFVLIYVLSGVLTRNLIVLTKAAERVADGEYMHKIAFPRQSRFPDEMDRLAQVFDVMVERIRTRERLIRHGKRVETEIRNALEEEKELNALKSRFISMVSHEFRTPLTVIRTSVELLEQYGHIASAAKRQEYFQRIRSAIRTMSHLMEDVLTIGRAEAGKLELELTPVDLEAFCQDLTDEIQLSIGKSHTISFTCDRNCPTSALVDPKLLRSILTNLLSNAVKYSPNGKPIDFHLTCSDTTAMFQIEDHGIGIPDEDQPKLFETFHRAQNAINIRGTGLGLAIVKQCIELHSGQVSFSSQQGVGTIFRVELPLNLSQSHLEQH